MTDPFKGKTAGSLTGTETGDDAFVSTPSQTPEDLSSYAERLTTARSQWYFGEWGELADLDLDACSSHPEIGLLTLLKAAGYFQLGDTAAARTYLQMALGFGCERRMVARIMIAGVHNTLAKATALLRQKERSRDHFYKAVSVGQGRADSKIAQQARSVREIVRLGLLGEAAEIVGEGLDTLDGPQAASADLYASIAVLRSELSLIQSELRIAQSRGQLLQAEPPAAVDAEASPQDLERLSTSQLGQDIWVLKRSNFLRDGFFVEFGAGDGVLLSNTFMLEKHFGWRGICAEPNAKYFKQLVANRECQLSDSCIGSRTGQRVDFILADDFGAIADYAELDHNADIRRAYKAAGEVTTMTTISLADFLERCNAPKHIDYLSIDTEGCEFDILKDFPFDRWRIALLTVEHNYTEQRDQLFELLTRWGYDRIEAQWDDWYYMRS
ncbi:MAG: FkbM family methyltransferase [Pseudomonadota bacterium]